MNSIPILQMRNLKLNKLINFLKAMELVSDRAGISARVWLQTGLPLRSQHLGGRKHFCPRNGEGAPRVVFPSLGEPQPP